MTKPEPRVVENVSGQRLVMPDGGETLNPGETVAVVDGDGVRELERVKAIRHKPNEDPKRPERASTEKKE